MNLSSVKTTNYEQITMNNANKNKPNLCHRYQTRSGAKIPTGELLAILKPGTNFKGKKMLLHLTINSDKKSFLLAGLRIERRCRENPDFHKGKTLLFFAALFDDLLE